MNRYKSITTETKIGISQAIAERILLTKYNLGNYFWSKKKAENFLQEPYNLNKRIILVIKYLQKNYSDELIWSTFNKFTTKQKRKILDEIKYNNIGNVISGFKYYLEKEKKLHNIYNKKTVHKIIHSDRFLFDVKSDYRQNKVLPRKNIWELISQQCSEEN